ncbi:recombinase family protein [Rhodococcus opacus]|uniref:recombinase family protein n=1 Tax=Rhodococcus opacus TaxID=37919 RepID=UPI00211DEB98|nr:recombinase family protein [Rhodococcus opacus]
MTVGNRGYARVSSADQNPDHQVDALRRAGVEAENVHVDHLVLARRRWRGG